jgi:uncharacterized protein YecE (DUF72 family)
MERSASKANGNPLSHAPGPVRIGTAGWSIPVQHAEAYAGEGSHLDRYAHHFAAVEINTSFYRPHRPSTYARWAASVPDGFRFAVKLPRDITHTARLLDTAPQLDAFLLEVRALGDRLGPLLAQLPPSLIFDAAGAQDLFAAFRDRHTGPIVCEPRHPSWFTEAADALLTQCEIARVAADPAPHPNAAQPGGWPGLTYHRLHGTPEIYYSPYPAETLQAVAATLRQEAASAQESWCIFDNTARGAAIADAAATQALTAEPKL